MDKQAAEARLRLLLQRSDLNADDKEALRLLLNQKQPSAEVAKQNKPDQPANRKGNLSSPPFELNRQAFVRRSPAIEELRICLDFGTAMSKAWATGGDARETLPLLIGKAAGADGLTVPSSVFISGIGRMFLGQEAERQHRADLRPGRARFDNLKRMLSEAEIGTELRAIPLRSGIDPTESGLTGGDLLVLYLAWLTDLSEDALDQAIAATKGKFSVGEFDVRGVARRYAIPCFESTDGNDGRRRSQWARTVMSSALLHAQVLADCVHGRWNQLTTASLFPLMEEVYQLDTTKLAHLIPQDGAIREPIAAGASRFDAALSHDDEPARVPIRQLLLIVDAGAGTTDFAMFQAITPIGQSHPRYGLLRRSVRMSRIAGNEIDTILRPLILQSCGVDPQILSADDLAYAQLDLDSRIREIKRNLFDQSTLQVELRPHFSGKMDLSTLLANSKMQDDGAELINLRKEILVALFTDPETGMLRQEQLDALRASNDGKPCQVYVLLTGGSATIPIIRELSSGELVLAGTRFRFDLVNRLPDWIDRLPREVAQLLADVYPQCAVAIGGSVPDLPKELDDLEIPVTPPLRGARVLPRTPISGI